MLKRIYIDNFRNLVNFELSLDAINLFLGENGAGKSSVFDVLRKIQAFVLDDSKAETLFSPTECTRWQTSRIQSFELEIVENDGVYKYKLAIEHEEKERQVRVHHENLWFNNHPLLNLHPSGEIEFYPDTGDVLHFPFVRSRSAVAAINPSRYHQRLTEFKDSISNLIIVQVNPIVIANDSEIETTRLSAKAENFVSWYSHLSQNQGKAIEITKVLKEVVSGFEHFRFVKAGERHRVLKVCLSGTDKNSVEYNFNELSDGERALIVLYSLLYGTRGENYTLCIDEPENFLALPEIEPWLSTLYDFCSAGETQALLISHHPELIDYLATSAGYWFDYQNNAPVRVKKISTEDDTGLPISELVARGWLYD